MVGERCEGHSEKVWRKAWRRRGEGLEKAWRRVGERPARRAVPADYLI
jgi:hypothetical protein